MATTHGEFGVIITELQAKRRDLLGRVHAIDKALNDLGGFTNGKVQEVISKEPVARMPKRGRKRSRRSSDQLKTDAAKLVQHIEAQGGATAAELRQVADFGLSLTKFVQQYARRKLKFSGPKNNRRYTL